MLNGCRQQGRKTMRATILILTLLILAPFQAYAQNRTGEGEVRDLYDTNCSACHGADLAGGSGASLWIG
jgi:mono/diheme cytochrome c family protein